MHVCMQVSSLLAKEMSVFFSTFCGALASSCSVTLNGVLPGVEELVVILLLAVDSALVLDLSKFGGTLLVHTVLELAAHSAITLIDLTKDISLVGLLVKSILESMGLMSLVLTIDLSIDEGLIVVLEPVSLLFEGLLEEDVLLTVLVHVLEEVDAGLVLTAPLLLTCVPLTLVLLLSK